MIKFFRKIRRNLLSEGRTGKYFKYAIGEILLVVIGILIALQINNWNENRKLNITTSEYIENLRLDIVQDTIGLNNLIQTGKDQVKIIENFKTYLLKSNDPIPIKVDSAVNLKVVFYIYFPINQTYLDIQYSGSSKLLSQNQRNVLTDLINQQNKICRVNESLINSATVELRNRNKYMDTYGLTNKVLGKPSTSEEIKLILRHQLNYLSLMEEMAETLTRFANRAKSSSNIAIKTLNE
jgi:hypothetical protein